jgi:hypothetical protein
VPLVLRQESCSALPWAEGNNSHTLAGTCAFSGTGVARLRRTNRILTASRWQPVTTTDATGLTRTPAIEQPGPADTATVGGHRRGWRIVAAFAVTQTVGYGVPPRRRRLSPGTRGDRRRVPGRRRRIIARASSPTPVPGRPPRRRREQPVAPACWATALSTWTASWPTACRPGNASTAQRRIRRRVWAGYRRDLPTGSAGGTKR